MAIQNASGDIVINHTTPITVTYAGEDASKGIERFTFSDSTLNEEHVFYKRDFGRSVSGAMATRRGKTTIVREKLTTDNVRRSVSLSVNLLAHSDFTSSELEGMVEDMGQFLLDNKTDLAAGNFDS